MDYVEAVRCLFRVTPVDAMKCLVNNESVKPISQLLELNGTEFKLWTVVVNILNLLCQIILAPYLILLSAFTN